MTFAATYRASGGRCVDRQRPAPAGVAIHGGKGRNDAHAVDVAAHQVSAEAIGEAQRLFEIYPRADVKAGGAAQRLAGHVEREKPVRTFPTTVRQQPATAMLSPFATSAQSERRSIDAYPRTIALRRRGR